LSVTNLRTLTKKKSKWTRRNSTSRLLPLLLKVTKS
jgi:hypothetical protein